MAQEVSLRVVDIDIHKEKGSAVQPLNASKEVGGITTKPNSANKVKDLIHNAQENDIKINLIKNNMDYSQEEFKKVMSELDAWVKKWNVDEKLYRYAWALSSPQKIREAMRKSEEYYKTHKPIINRKGEEEKRKVVIKFW